MKILNLLKNITFSKPDNNKAVLSQTPCVGTKTGCSPVLGVSSEKDTVSVRKEQISELKLTPRRLVKTHPLHVLLCNRLGVDVSQFESVDEIEQFAQKRLELIGVKEDEIEEKIKIEKIFKNSGAIDKISFKEYREIFNSFANSKEKQVHKFYKNMNNEESDPIKKLLLYLDVQKNKDGCVSYNKEIAQATFDELFNKMKKDSNSNFDTYKTYSYKYLNSDKIDLEMPIDMQGEFGYKKVVLVDSEDTVGSFGIQPIDGDNKAYLHSLIVRTPFRHSPVSKNALNIMFKEAETVCRETGLQSIVLDVISGNTPAVQGYINKQGFQCVDFNLKNCGQKMEKTLYDSVLSPEEVERREQGTKLLSEFSLMNENLRNQILDLAHNRLRFYFDDEAKEFFKKYKDYRSKFKSDQQ